jgi:hypothetical protein
MARLKSGEDVVVVDGWIDGEGWEEDRRNVASRRVVSRRVQGVGFGPRRAARGSLDRAGFWLASIMDSNSLGMDIENGR